MYFVYGCPKVLHLKPQEQAASSSSSNSSRTLVLPAAGREEILAIAFNPSGSLLAVASTSRVCVWSGGKDHVPLGSLALRLRALSSGGTTLLWRRDSSCVGALSAAGKLTLVSVTRKAFGATAVGVGERFAVPDWYEPQVCVGVCVCVGGGCLVWKRFVACACVCVCAVGDRKDVQNVQSLRKRHAAILAHLVEQKRVAMCNCSADPLHTKMPVVHLTSRSFIWPFSQDGTMNDPRLLTPRAIMIV